MIFKTFLPLFRYYAFQPAACIAEKRNIQSHMHGSSITVALCTHQIYLLYRRRLHDVEREAAHDADEEEGGAERPAVADADGLRHGAAGAAINQTVASCLGGGRAACFCEKGREVRRNYILGRSNGRRDRTFRRMVSISLRLQLHVYLNMQMKGFFSQRAIDRLHSVPMPYNVGKALFPLSNPTQVRKNKRSAAYKYLFGRPDDISTQQ